MYQLSIKRLHAGERGRTWLSEEGILVGREYNQVTTLFLLVGEHHWVKKTIIISNHKDQFHPVWEPRS